MAKKLFQTDFGFSDGNIHYLSGSGAPGGDTFHNAAPVGSKYTDFAATPPLQYIKVTTGSGSDKWALAIAETSRLVKEITQASHGFAVGDCLYRDQATQAYVKADQADPDTADVIGIVSAVKSTNVFDLTTHGFSGVPSALPDGAPLFLGANGQVTNVKPVAGVQKNIGFVLGNTIFIAIGLSIELSSDEAPGVPLILTDAVTTIRAVAAVPTAEGEVALWHVCANGTAGKYTTIVNANHNKFGAGDATVADFTEFGILEAGAIADLAIGVRLTGAGATQQLELVVSSTDSVNVHVRQIRT